MNVSAASLLCLAIIQVSLKQDVTSLYTALCLMGPFSRALMGRLTPDPIDSKSFPFFTSRWIDNKKLMCEMNLFPFQSKFMVALKPFRNSKLPQIHGHSLRPGHPDHEYDPHGRARLCLLHTEWVCNPRLWLDHGGGAEVWAQALWLLCPACCQNRKILRLLGPGLIFSMFNYAEDPYIWLVGPWQLHNPDGVRPSFQMQNEGWYPLHWTRGFTGAGCQEALHAFKQHYHWYLCEFYWRRWSMV